MDTGRMFCGAVLALAGMAPAYALRPFDGTDADVAGAGVLELELGYVGYLQQGAQHVLTAPAAVLNLGLERRRELVVEGRLDYPVHPQTGDAGTTFRDAAISVKQVHRNGILQEAPGPSLASECGILLPTVRGERTGAACAGIVSWRWADTTWHVDAALGRSREGGWEKSVDAIAVGPGVGAVRPVAEILASRDPGGGYTRSALAGAIWPVKDDLSFDIGLRRARTDGYGITEIRVGLTLSRALRRHK